VNPTKPPVTSLLNAKEHFKDLLVGAGRFVRADYWAIAMYRGPSPLALGPADGVQLPVLGARDVTDVDAEFVADPFMVVADGGWHLFFEVMNRSTGLGEIAMAASPDATTWTYGQVVLAESHHLSYPQVFAWDGEHWMVPETSAERCVMLYRAAEYPTRWERAGVLLSGLPFNDATLFRHDERWWMLTETAEDVRSDTLRLYSTADVRRGWVEHPASPVVAGDATIARPAGRVVRHEGRLVRFAQDCATDYGKRVSAFEIVDLTPSTYRERPLGVVLEPSAVGWNDHGMHHVDAHRTGAGEWLACVDGRPAPGLRRSAAARIPTRQRPRPAHRR